MVILYKLLALVWYRSLLEATTFKGTAKVCEGVSGRSRARPRERIDQFGKRGELENLVSNVGVWPNWHGRLA